MPVGYPAEPLPIGARFGKLVVTSNVGRNEHGHRCTQVICDCGNTRTVLAGNLRHGKTASCGCLRRSVSRAAMNALHAKNRAATVSPFSSP